MLMINATGIWLGIKTSWDRAFSSERYGGLEVKKIVSISITIFLSSQTRARNPRDTNRLGHGDQPEFDSELGAQNSRVETQRHRRHHRATSHLSAAICHLHRGDSSAKGRITFASRRAQSGLTPLTVPPTGHTASSLDPSRGIHFPLRSGAPGELRGGLRDDQAMVIIHPVSSLHPTTTANHGTS